MNVMMLAAGLGTRLRPYTESTPKPAIPFLKVPLAVYSLSLLENEKIDNLVVNTHHLPKQVEGLFQKINWPANKLIFSDETQKILGSGGAIRKAIAHLKGQGHFIVMNADEVILPHQKNLTKDLMETHRKTNSIATLLTMNHAEVGKKFGGAWVNQNSQVVQFSKTQIPDTKGLHYLGVAVISDKIEQYFDQDQSSEENILYETLTRAMKDNQVVTCHNCQAHWFETGNPEDFLKATEICQAEMKKKNQAFWVQYLTEIHQKYGVETPIIEK